MARATQNNFNGGITSNIREATSTKAHVISKFDINTHRDRALPTFDTGANGGSETKKIVNVTVGEGADFLWGLGTKVSDTPFAIFQADVVGGWTDGEGTFEAGSATAEPYSFMAYNDYIYGLGSLGNWRYGPLTGSETVTQSYQALTLATGSGTNGVIHPDDDNLYFAYYNSGARVLSNDGGVITNAALALPTNRFPMSIAAYGNYLAIGCRSTTATGQDKSTEDSVVYLWNRVDTDVTESIDFGNGQLKVLAEVGGELIGIVQEEDHNSQTFIHIKRFIGNREVETLFTLADDDPSETGNGTHLTPAKFVRNNTLLFFTGLSLYGSSPARVDGIWEFGKKGAGQPFTLTKKFEIDSTERTEVVTGIYHNQGNMQICRQQESGVPETMSISTNYSTASVIETVINPGMVADHKFMNKDFKTLRVNHAPLPAAGQVVVKYRKDGGTTWSSAVVTNTTNSTLVTDVDPDIGEFTEAQFRIESTGGAEILGLTYTYEPTGR